MVIFFVNLLIFLIQSGCFYRETGYSLAWFKGTSRAKPSMDVFEPSKSRGWVHRRTELPKQEVLIRTQWPAHEITKDVKITNYRVQIVRHSDNHGGYAQIRGTHSPANPVVSLVTSIMAGESHIRGRF